MLFVLHSLFLLGYVAVEGINVALDKPTRSSSVHSTPSSVAVDGNPSSNWASGSCFAVATCDLHPWWQVDLQQAYMVAEVKVIVRADCCPQRFHDVSVEVFEKDPTNFPAAASHQCSFFGGTVSAGQTVNITCTPGPVTGRYVRLTGLAKTNPIDILQFCEVQVEGVPVNPVAPATNLALHRLTAASSIYESAFPPNKAVDGNGSPVWASGSCFATAICDRFPWWQVDLGSSYCVTEVKVIVRSDCCPERFEDIAVQVYEQDPVSTPSASATICTVYRNQMPSAGETVSLFCDVPVPGRYVRLSANQERLNSNLLQFCEVQVFGNHSCNV